MINALNDTFPFTPLPDSIDLRMPDRSAVRFCFDEPLMSSDAGLLALAGYAQRSGDIGRIAVALTPKLSPGASAPRTPTHSTAQLLTQRVMQLIGGYPDGNDSDLLRHDPVLQMLVGRATPGSPEAVLASQPTMSRLDNKASLRDLIRAFDALVDNFIASYQDRPPEGLVLDPMIIIALTTVFYFAILSALIRGLNIECGCFGILVGKTIGLQSLAIDVGFLCLSALLMWRTQDLITLSPAQRGQNPSLPDSSAAPRPMTNSEGERK